ncbi:MAG: hypothetical protein H6819_01975 [Phycisphaerales bacterium]|nr:hypothetical protein [Phycisphaerales bacterium]MCB9857020.1 hypothetical protein [Phycisphaerales bacterium]MCB9861853.1 hypothetical protein [Phycisphaerales bacterium]
MWSDEQLRETLNDMLVEVLAVEPEDLAPDARFFEDLGGESIDVLELTFLAEKRFGRRVEFQRMVAADELDFDQDRRLTEASIAKIGELLPFIDLAQLRRDPRAESLPRLLTVENLFQYLRQIVHSPASGPATA